MAVCRQLAAAVRHAIVEGHFPFVLAGSCDVSKGVLADFRHERCGVVWIDAHADFNTPESTVTGFLPGMSLAVIAGHCYRNYWAEIGDNGPVPEAATLLLGVRELDPAERERLTRSAIRVIEWHKGEPPG
jgi:arginase